MIRFGVIGTNWITDHFIEAAGEIEGFALTAVYSRTEERAAAFAGKHGIPNTFTDAAAMAASDVIDAVYIASPTSTHAEQAILFMSKGKHVLCEKPAASNARELQQMIEAAERYDVVFMEAMKSTLLPGFQAVAANLPQLGKIRRYFASYCQYSSRYDAYRAGQVLNAFKPEYSNGALMDLGVYCVFPMIVLFGKPEEVRASGYMLESGVDGQGSLIAKYPGMEASIMYSKISNSSLLAEIQGEEGTMTIDSINIPRKVQIHYRDGRIEDVSRPTDRHTMSYEVEEFMELIRSGERQSKLNSHANSLAVMQVLDEARRQQGLVFPADLQ
ncbi:Gfo/Idh/MocA family protein [Paenibacillus montanisoli]|uniref:Oxidoreductase n=1 Tax=Paenibacillus montanisoli TaxID=2081970 RepID=A0A328U2A6_9BACL|nr:Gfo/Idh/MocA family oxidoreductase [Paenibacillus montanisoli]RAP76810.1 oxidoreductase [Paenibacillus montanisoli]